MGSGNWTQIRQWKLNPNLAVETGPKLGSVILDPNWAMETGPEWASGNWTQIGQCDTGPKLGNGNWTQNGQWILYYTVWKFPDLREISLGDSRSAN